jgi:putative endonuclease
MYYVYILTCKDNKLYTGCTKDLKERIDRHQAGHVPATAKVLPVQISFYFAIKEKSVAYNFEKYLKSGSGRAFLQRHIL